MRSARLTAVVLLALAAVACGESATGVATRPAPRRLVGNELAQVHLVECPASEASAATEVDVAPSGGDVVAGKRRVRVPAGAVSQPVRVAMMSPASPYVELELHAVGYAQYTFRRPVAVTIDYGRCGAAAIPDPSRLHVVYVDATTKQVLEDMGGVVDTAARTITFETAHFSSYAVAD